MAEDSGDRSLQQSDITVTELFRALWDDLRVTMGSAPTAALLRRAISMCGNSCPNLGTISIERIGRDYSYSIPQRVEEAPNINDELHTFIDNVLSLLAELTGNVLVRHLMENPVIRRFTARGGQ